MPQMKASASFTRLSPHHFTPAISFLREHGDREAVAAAEPNPPKPSAIVRFL